MIIQDDLVRMKRDSCGIVKREQTLIVARDHMTWNDPGDAIYVKYLTKQSMSPFTVLIKDVEKI